MEQLAMLHAFWSALGPSDRRQLARNIEDMLARDAGAAVLCVRSPGEKDAAIEAARLRRTNPGFIAATDALAAVEAWAAGHSPSPPPAPCWPNTDALFLYPDTPASR